MELFKDSVDYMRGIYRFQERLGRGNIILTYQGEVTQDIVRSLTSLIETNLAKIEEDETVIARVYHIMIECLQNIIKHGGELDGDELLKQRSGIFLGEGEHKYIITTGNLIANEKIPGMTKMLDALNSMNNTELKELYMDKVYHGKVSQKGGAGLGFIEMARKTSEPIEYYLEYVSESTSYLLLNLSVDKKENKTRSSQIRNNLGEN